MTKTLTQAAALALSAVMTLAVVTSMNGIATTQYVKADNRAMASLGMDQVAVQHVTIIGHRANA